MICPYCNKNLGSGHFLRCPYCHGDIEKYFEEHPSMLWPILKLPFTIIGWCLSPKRLKWILRALVYLLAALYIAEKCS